MALPIAHQRKSLLGIDSASCPNIGVRSRAFFTAKGMTPSWD